MVRAGRWTGWALDQLLGQSLLGKTVGIVGFGRIGQAMARRAFGFGMRVIYADPSPASSSSVSSLGTSPSFVSERVDLDTLFATADVVSLHCPLTPDTRHLVNAARLARMRPTAVLVNTARGGCVDEQALVDALERGQLVAAGLDVYSNEPEIHPGLVASERVVLAPHIGSATTEARTQMAQLCADAVIAVLSGRTPPNVVRAKGGA